MLVWFRRRRFARIRLFSDLLETFRLVENRFVAHLRCGILMVILGH
jgi:hypothetical protein